MVEECQAVAPDELDVSVEVLPDVTDVDRDLPTGGHLVDERAAVAADVDDR